MQYSEEFTVSSKKVDFWRGLVWKLPFTHTESKREGGGNWSLINTLWIKKMMCKSALARQQKTLRIVKYSKILDFQCKNISHSLNNTCIYDISKYTTLLILSCLNIHWYLPAWPEFNSDPCALQSFSLSLKPRFINFCWESTDDFNL